MQAKMLTGLLQKLEDVCLHLNQPRRWTAQTSDLQWIFPTQLNFLLDLTVAAPSMEKELCSKGVIPEMQLAFTLSLLSEGVDFVLKMELRLSLPNTPGSDS